MKSTGLSESIRTAAKAAARKIAGTRGLEGVVLCGSAAAGAAGDGSDADVALLGTRDGCRRAARRLPERVAGVRLQTIALAREDGYGGAGCWGHIGREVLDTGITLWGGERVKEIAKGEVKPMPAAEVAARQRTTLLALDDAARAWMRYRELGHPEALDNAARHGIRAAEHTVKNYLHYRGHHYLYHHDLPKLAEKAEPDPQRAVVFHETPEEVKQGVEQIARALNGHSARENMSDYFEVSIEPEAENRVGRRLALVLSVAYDENERVKAAAGMETVAAAVAPGEKNLARTLAALADDPLPSISAAGARWREAGGVEQKERGREQGVRPRRQGGGAGRAPS